MRKAKRITEAELNIMKVLWKQSPINAGDIIQALRKKTQWSPKTIHTLISRLVSKEAVGITKATPYNLYFPIVSEEEYKSAQTKSFINKVYDGSIHHLVVNFIKEEKLSKEELNELRKLLDRKEKESE